MFYIANASMSKMQKTYLDGPAELVIEVVSKDSRTRDKTEKRTEYERHRIPEYWIIDHEREQATFLQLNEEGRYVEVLPDDEGIYRCSVLPGLWLQVSWLWQNPLPTHFFVYRAWGLI